MQNRKQTDPPVVERVAVSGPATTVTPGGMENAGTIPLSRSPTRNLINKAVSNNNKVGSSDRNNTAAGGSQGLKKPWHLEHRNKFQQLNLMATNVLETEAMKLLKEAYKKGF